MWRAKASSNSWLDIGLLIEQFAYAGESGAGEIELGLCRGKGLAGLVLRSPGFVAGGLGASANSLQIAGIQGGEQGALANVIAGLNAHVAHIGHHLGGDGGAVRARTVPTAS